ncbi:MAG: hypothetical protein M0Q24_07985 [Sulfurimonas sp.]|uniref:hypothetical protein n=1 Tax=Sulfurimonas sp. TaxID=2022749 RepID=UPI0025F9BA92|nr:hypothetical protein [Sulfurimonas sp.]MCK9492015.1 hypothetical protein [Sulfurimonas sp.]
MKLYVKAVSSYRGHLDGSEIKKELKTKYKLDTRRQDTFIHLAIYGAQLLKDKVEISSSDELYITSGVGNIDVLQKTNKYVYEEKEFIKPFDFINMLGNTTSYYVANSLGLKDKNTFQISNNFTFINTLISVFASLNLSQNEAIIGSVDLCTNPNEVIKRVLGLDEDAEVTSSVNYQKLSLSSSGAIAEVEFDTKIYSLQEVQELIKNSDLKVMTSPRCKGLDSLKDSEYFETMPSYYLNKTIQEKEKMLYIDCFEDSYKIIKIIALA